SSPRQQKPAVAIPGHKTWIRESSLTAKLLPCRPISIGSASCGPTIRLALWGAVSTDRTSNVSRLDDGPPAGDLLHTPASVWLAVFGYHEVFHLLVIAGARPPPSALAA